MVKFRIILLILPFLTVVSGCKYDNRASDFENYILSQADSIAYSKCTNEELQSYIDSRHKYGNLYDCWIENLESDLKVVRKHLYEESKVIHNLDRQAGRELSFPEALDIVMAHADTFYYTKANQIVLLQRHIEMLNYNNECLIVDKESKKWERLSK